MGSSARAALVGLCLAAAPYALTAHAQTNDRATAEARKHFDVGLEHYKAGRYAEALEEFQKANEISPRESLQRNVAQTQRDLRDYASAYESYDKLLKTYGRAMKPEDKAAAEQALEELSTLTGQIAVFVNLPKAVVVVDERERGEPPTTVRANSGRHHVQVRAPGYQTLDRQIELKGKDKVAINGPLAEAGPAPGLAPVDVPAPRTIEPPPASSTAELEKWAGLYARIELSGVFPTAHHDTVSDGDVYGPVVPVKGSGLYGAGMGVHVGYSFGDYGIEGFVTAAYDHASVSADLGTRKDDWNFYRGGGVIGTAARYTPHFDELGPVRPTAAIGIGLAGRAVGYQRLIENTTSKDKASFQFYMAPSLMADVGFLIGQTPGAKFYLGLMMMLEFPGGTELPSGNSKDGKYPIAANAKVEAANGVEFFLGPSLGLAFGH